MLFEVIVDARRTTTDAGHPTIRIVPHEHVVLRGTKKGFINTQTRVVYFWLKFKHATIRVLKI